jgi:hypothetical protein
MRRIETARLASIGVDIFLVSAGLQVEGRDTIKLLYFGPSRGDSLNLGDTQRSLTPRKSAGFRVESERRRSAVAAVIIVLAGCTKAVCAGSPSGPRLN